MDFILSLCFSLTLPLNDQAGPHWYFSATSKVFCGGSIQNTDPETSDVQFGIGVQLTEAMNGKDE